MGARSPVVLAALFALGCANPDGVMDDFAARYAQTHPDGGTAGGDGDACEAPTAEQLSGDYLLTISPGFSPKTPILLLGRLDAEASGNDRLAVDMTLTPLSAADRSTPVGDALPVIPLELPTGAFTADLGKLDLPGEADPVLPGSAIVGTVVLHGTLCAATPTIDLLCGTASGNVTLPVAIGLEGSTWTLRRLPSEGVLPEVALDCALNPPDPL